jgi:hypothetical protein
MSNVLRRLFHRSAQREQVERKHGNRGEAASMPWPPTPWPGPVQPANDPGPVPAVKPTGHAVPAVKQTGDADEPAAAPERVAPDVTSDQAPSDPASASAVKPVSDDEIIERQIAALISAWNETSLCARREFLTRIDQRILTTHRIRSASRQATASAEAADGISAG